MSASHAGLSSRTPTTPETKDYSSEIQADLNNLSTYFDVVVLNRFLNDLEEEIKSQAEPDLHAQPGSTHSPNPKIKKNQLIQAIKDISFVITTLRQNGKLTKYALINWAQVYLHSEMENPEELLSLISDPLKGLTEGADKQMTNVYLALNFFGLLVAVSKIPTVLSGTDLDALSCIQDDTLNTDLSLGWNYFDALGGSAVAARQLMQGEIHAGMANMLSSLQLTTCSVLAHLKDVVGLSSTVAGNLLGFSFAACMAISCGIELYQAEQCEKRVSIFQSDLPKIEEEINKIETDLDVLKIKLANLLSEKVFPDEDLSKGVHKEEKFYNLSTHEQISEPFNMSEEKVKNISEKVKERNIEAEIKGLNKEIKELEKRQKENKQKSSVLQKSILLEQAQAANHRRAAKAWAGCAIAMTMVALGVSTLGVGLAGAAIVAGFAFVTGVIRKQWVKQVDYVKNAQDAISKPSKPLPIKPPENFWEETKSTPITFTEKLPYPTLFDQLQDAIKNTNHLINFDKVVEVPGRLIFSKVNISFRTYLLELITRNPVKLKAIINALNEMSAINQGLVGIRAINPPKMDSNLAWILQNYSQSSTKGLAIYEASKQTLVIS